MDWSETIYLAFLVLSPSVLGQSIQECVSENSVVVCEGGSATINCGLNLINICTALYGRTDTTTCPGGPISNTECRLDVLNELSSACDNQTNCLLNASNDIAGDPCDGTTKYLSVNYTCADVNECAANSSLCHKFAQCTNTIGSYSCDCFDGFTGNGYNNCTDVDECIDGTTTCDVNAVCTNTPGSFLCSCEAGYAGNGLRCADIDECTSGTDTCDTSAACTNTPASFICNCIEGYQGDGFNCTDVDECTARIDNCGTNGSCVNTPGSFACTCNAGYTFNGTICIVDQMNTVTTTVPPPQIQSNVGAAVAAVVVLLVVLVVVIIVAVICYRRRHLSSTKDLAQPPSNSMTVLNQTYGYENDHDKREYAECGDFTGSPTQLKEYEYADIPESTTQSKEGNVDIYDAVGEVQDDYGYSRLEVEQSNNPEEDGNYLEIIPGNDSLENGDVSEKSVPKDEAINSGVQKTPTDDHVYQDVSQENDNYISIYEDVPKSSNPSNQENALPVANTYQALKTDAPEYLSLDFDTNGASSKPETHAYQALKKDTSDPVYYALESNEGEYSLNAETRTDDTYQHLVEGTNLSQSQDENHSNTGIAENTSDDSYDLLQRDMKISE